MSPKHYEFIILRLLIRFVRKKSLTSFHGENNIKMSPSRRIKWREIEQERTGCTLGSVVFITSPTTVSIQGRRRPFFVDGFIFHAVRK